jgi:CRISPR-associated protein Cmr3
MAEQYLSIRGLDPLLFRDGRPFSNEIGAMAAQTLALPLPGTVAGMLRTRVGNLQGWTWDAADAARAREIPVAGPILLRNNIPVFSSPADGVIYEDDCDKLKTMCLRPYAPPAGADCNIPGGLQPLKVTGEGKPESGYDYWTWPTLKKWLMHPSGDGFTPPTLAGKPPQDNRPHVMIVPGSGTSEEGMLFTTRSLCFGEHPRWPETQEQNASKEWAFLVRLNDSTKVSGAAPFGGERRLAVLEEADSSAWPLPPIELMDALNGKDKMRLRLVLATPAIFSEGWKPGLLINGLELLLPGINVKLTLKAAAVKRREPVSGWDYQAQPRGPKPVRWMVPAGSVYFFEAEGDLTHLVKSTWLRSVSDDDSDKKDGYGLALWGLW